MAQHGAAEGTSPRVLALIPSRGLGGGIESYVGAALEALEAAGADVTRLVLRDGPESTPSLSKKVRFTREVASAARGRNDLVIIAFHAALAPVAYLGRRVAGPRARAFVIQHGWEIWTAGIVRRRWDANKGLHQVAVSSFSAGALAARAAADILHPGIPQSRYNRLLAGARSPEPQSEALRILSVFRLGEANGKGAYGLADACRISREAGKEVRLTMAGRGPAPSRLEALAQTTGWVTILTSPTDEQLDAAYGAADLFVLATRTSHSARGSTGEGFGIALIEAALAGLPVIAPASGGSFDAFLDGLTGLRPRDETPEALARIISWAAGHPAERERLGGNGKAWARAVFDPALYSKSVADLFLGRHNASAVPVDIRETR